MTEIVNEVEEDLTEYDGNWDVDEALGDEIMTNNKKKINTNTMIKY